MGIPPAGTGLRVGIYEPVCHCCTGIGEDNAKPIQPVEFVALQCVGKLRPSAWPAAVGTRSIEAAGLRS